jgi:hypothetical protein
VLEIAAPPRARPRHRADAADDLDVGQVGLRHDAHRLVVGHEAEFHRVEVHEERVGAGVVGAARIVVEAAGVVRRRGREPGAVDDDVAADLADAARTQVVEREPDAVDGELGIAAAPDVEVAFQDSRR